MIYMSKKMLFAMLCLGLPVSEVRAVHWAVQMGGAIGSGVGARLLHDIVKQRVVSQLPEDGRSAAEKLTEAASYIVPAVSFYNWGNTKVWTVYLATLATFVNIVTDQFCNDTLSTGVSLETALLNRVNAETQVKNAEEKLQALKSKITKNNKTKASNAPLVLPSGRKDDLKDGN
jgi:hypothetical protein